MTPDEFKTPRERAAALRAWVEANGLSERNARSAAEAPPFTPEQRDRLALLLNGGGGVVPARGLDRTPPPPMPERTALYRHYDKDDLLLYVGISKNLDSRRRSHMRRSAWFEFATRETVEWFETREAAKSAETAAIRDEEPLFNSSEAADSRDVRLVEYAVKHSAWHLLRPAAAVTA